MARFYVFSVQYNKEKHAENRTVPLAYDEYEKAVQKFHEVLSNDMKNPTLGWSLCMVIGDNGAPLRNERWDAPVEETPETGE